MNIRLVEALTCMGAAETGDYVRDFVTQVLRTGLMLVDVAADLIENLPDDAYPGESNAEVVLEMLIGTLRPVTEAAGERSVRSAVALLAASQDRTLADLECAAELARRRVGRDSPPGRPGV